MSPIIKTYYKFAKGPYSKYIQNFSWLFCYRIFNLIGVLLTSIVVARYLKPELFGTLNYAAAFVGILVAIPSLGLDSILVRDLVRKEKSENYLLGTAFFLRLSASVIFFCIIVGIQPFTANTHEQIFLILLIASAEIFKSSNIFDLFFQSKVKSKYSVISGSISSGVGILLKISFVFFQFPLWPFALVISIEAFINGVLLWYHYESSGNSIKKWKFDLSIAKTLLKESWPLLFYGIALHIQARIDQVMIGNILGSEEVGQYSVALKMIEVIGFIPVIVASTFAPKITESKLKGKSEYRNNRLQYYRLMFILFLLAALPIYFLAEFIVIALYGTDYASAGYLLSLFAIRLFFTNMGVAKSSFITNESLFRYSLLTAVIGVSTNISINLVMIPLLGSKGAIVATIISFFVSIFLVDLFYVKTRDNIQLMILAISSFWKIRTTK